MKYEPKPLPFTTKLDGISDKTMQIHHDKLYVGYVNKRNEIIEKLASVDRTNINATYSDYRELKLEETFTTNAQYLHEYYFSILGGAGKPEGELIKAIEAEFGSFEKWLEDFRAAGMVARGWVVLAFDFNDGKLHNYLCDAHNHGGIWAAMPIIVLDIYEHAYFIDFGSDRKSYIDAYFKNFDWKAANELYSRVQKMMSA